jgi:hypothetical protein
VSERTPHYEPPPYPIPDFDVWLDVEAGRWYGQHQTSDLTIEAATLTGLEIRVEAHRAALTLRRALARLPILHNPRGLR